MFDRSQPEDQEVGEGPDFYPVVSSPAVRDPRVQFFTELYYHHPWVCQHSEHQHLQGQWVLLPRKYRKNEPSPEKEDIKLCAVWDPSNAYAVPQRSSVFV